MLGRSHAPPPGPSAEAGEVTQLQRYQAKFGCAGREGGGHVALQPACEQGRV
jgi:hypothetical protein